MARTVLGTGIATQISGTLPVYSTATRREARVPAACTWSKLTVRVYANTLNASLAFTAQKNGTNTAMSVTVPAGTTGTFQDSVNSVSLAAGDLITYQLSTLATDGSISRNISSVLDGANQLVLRQANFGQNNRFGAVFPSATSTTESDYQWKLPTVAVTVRELWCKVSHSASTNATLTLRRNATDAASISIPANTTGWLSTTGLAISLAVGDLIDWTLTGGAPAINTAQVVLDPADKQPAGAGTSTSMTTAIYTPFLGTLSDNATLANVETVVPIAATATGGSITVSASAKNQATTLSLYRNGTGSAVLSIPASTTGQFSDNTFQLSIAAGDRVAWGLSSTDTTNTLTFTVVGTSLSFPLTYTQSLSGAISPAGSLAKQTAKGLGGAVSPGGTLQASRTKKQTLSGALGPSGVVSTARTRVLGLAGAISPTGALAKRGQKLLTGALSPTGTVYKRVPRALAGAISPAGALAKRAQKVLAGGLTPTGALAKAAQRTLALAGAITPAGTVTLALRTTATLLRVAVVPALKLRALAWGAGLLVRRSLRGE